MQTSKKNKYFYIFKSFPSLANNFIRKNIMIIIIFLTDSI